MKRITAMILVLALALSLCVSASALESGLDKALTKTYNYLKTQDLGYGTHFVIMGMAQSGLEVPDSLMQGYLTAMEEHAKSLGGVLSERKYTEYSAAILGIKAAGGDPQSFCGYDLVKPLSDYDKVVSQGINGAIYALLALDYGEYSSSQKSRYISYILDRQLEDKGWAFSGSQADTDITAMVLQALAQYTGRKNVSSAVEQAVAKLAAMQDSSGGYYSCGIINAESCAQVVLALSQLGISPEDGRFTKKGGSVLEALLSFQLSDGSFCHEAGGETSFLATAQAFQALVAAKRYFDGYGGVYSPERYGDFTDVSGHWAETAIYYVRDKGLFSGVTTTRFQPEGTLSRAMLVTVLYRMEGEPSVKSSAGFTDVADGLWYSKAVAWASDKGLVNGYGDGRFGPNDQITRAQLATIMGRLAKLQNRTAPNLTSYAAPGGSATRAETAYILMNYLTK